MNYAAAKAGIASMTIVMARELERIGVRVNAIAPVARTRLTEAVAGDFMNQKDGDFDRFAPENAAAMAIWLASPDSAGITGQVFAVGGGKAQLLQGWRPVTEVGRDRRVVARLARPPPATRSPAGATRACRRSCRRSRADHGSCISPGDRRTTRSAPSSSRSSTSTRRRRP